MGTVLGFEGDMAKQDEVIPMRKYHSAWTVNICQVLPAGDGSKNKSITNTQNTS